MRPDASLSQAAPTRRSKRTHYRLPAIGAVLLALAAPTPALGASIQLSFPGSVDVSGATLGGVDAPFGSPFTLDVTIDDSTAPIGRYAITGISYTLTLGTYTTVTNWVGVVDLVATPSGPSINLASDPLFADPNEEFLLNLTGFGPASFDDPSTWGGPSPLTGDIIVRGIGGFASPDQLSGSQPYTGTLTLTVPEPAAALLLASGLLGLGWVARRRLH